MRALNRTSGYHVRVLRVMRHRYSSIEPEAATRVNGSRLRAAGPGRGRRASPRHRAIGWLLIAVSFWALVACGIEPVPPPGETERLDLVAQAPIAGALVEFALPPGVTFVSVEPLRSHLLLRSSVRDDRLRVAWMADTAMAGVQLRFTLQRNDDQKGSLEIASANTFEGSGGDDLGAAVLVWRTTGNAPVLDAPLAPGVFDHASAPPTLLPAFADHPLGDINADGELDVRDGLALLDLLRTGWSWTDYTTYHGDLDGDDVIDSTDLGLLLDRLVDPYLPARLHVKPRQLSFVQIDPATDRDAVVLVANQGVLPFVDLTWTPPAGVLATVTGGIPGQSVALELTLPVAARRGWRPGFLRVAAAGDEAEVRVGHLVALIAGQSNASGRGAPLAGWPDVSSGAVRMLGNDYRWRNATEPLDDATGQLEFDWVSIDTAAAYSFGTRLGNRLTEATGFETALIPAARGGTSISDWLPPASPLDRDFLFGSANFRSQVSAGLQSNPATAQPSPSEGGPVTVIVWYQGESDASSSSRRSSYWNYTNQVMNAFYSELGAPVVYVQLASHCVEQNHVQQHAVAELQRRMETGPGYDEARQGRHMVVAFDLPRSDCIHLSAYGQRLLAERIELAVRQHVLEEDVDGVGPRLVAVSHTGLDITLRTTHHLDANPLDIMLFTVFDGPPSGSLDDVGSYGGNAIEIVSVVRDAGDPTAVRLTLSRLPTQTPHVRYMARPNQRPITNNSSPADPDVWEIVADGVIRGSDGGLPLPTFGPVSPFGGS